jgi:hypothetical protein
MIVTISQTDVTVSVCHTDVTNVELNLDSRMLEKFCKQLTNLMSL